MQIPLCQKRKKWHNCVLFHRSSFCCAPFFTRFHFHLKKQDMQCKHKVILLHVRITTVAMETRMRSVCIVELIFRRPFLTLPIYLSLTPLSLPNIPFAFSVLLTVLHFFHLPFLAFVILFFWLCFLHFHIPHSRLTALCHEMCLWPNKKWHV